MIGLEPCTDTGYRRKALAKTMSGFLWCQEKLYFAGKTLPVRKAPFPSSRCRCEAIAQNSAGAMARVKNSCFCWFCLLPVPWQLTRCTCQRLGWLPPQVATTRITGQQRWRVAPPPEVVLSQLADHSYERMAFAISSHAGHLLFSRLRDVVARSCQQEPFFNNFILPSDRTPLLEFGLTLGGWNMRQQEISTSKCPLHEDSMVIWETHAIWITSHWSCAKGVAALGPASVTSELGLGLQHANDESNM